MGSLLVQSWNGLNGVQLEELKIYKGLYKDIKRKIDEHRVKRWLLNQVKWIRKLKQIFRIISVELDEKFSSHYTERMRKRLIHWALMRGHYSLVNQMELSTIIPPFTETLRYYHFQPAWANFRSVYHNYWIAKLILQKCIDINPTQGASQCLNALILFKRLGIASKFIKGLNYTEGWRVGINHFRLFEDTYSTINNTKLLKLLVEKELIDINRIKYHQGCSLRFIEFLTEQNVPLQQIERKYMLHNIVTFNQFTYYSVLNYWYNNGAEITNGVINQAIRNHDLTMIKFAHSKKFRFSNTNLEYLIDEFCHYYGCLVVESTTKVLKRLNKKPEKLFETLEFILSTRKWYGIELLFAKRYYTQKKQEIVKHCHSRFYSNKKYKLHQPKFQEFLDTNGKQLQGYLSEIKKSDFN